MLLNIKKRIQDICEIENCFHYGIKETRNSGWGNERGVEIPYTQWQKARSFFYFLMDKNIDIQVPRINPCADGTIHMSWINNGDICGLEFDQDKIFWSFSPKLEPGIIIEVKDFYEAYEFLQNFFK